MRPPQRTLGGDAAQRDLPTPRGALGPGMTPDCNAIQPYMRSIPYINKEHICPYVPLSFMAPCYTTRCCVTRCDVTALGPGHGTAPPVSPGPPRGAGEGRPRRCAGFDDGFWGIPSCLPTRYPSSSLSLLSLLSPPFFSRTPKPCSLPS